MISSTSDASIVVLDDMFPHPGSTFRHEEFRRILDAFPLARVLCSGKALHHAGETRPLEAVIADHLREHPEHVGRILPPTPGPLPRADLYYCVFYHLISEHFEAIEASGSPFAVTLYPGGCLAPGEPGCDARLRRILGSRWCRGILVTQAALRDHLVERCGVDPASVSVIYGGVCPPDVLLSRPHGTRYGREKPVFDLCFIANRYTPTGADKGYDLFVGVARALAEMGRDVRFHVVGPFDATIVDLGEAATRFTFHGPRPVDRIRDLLAGFDAILSPTRPGLLHAGAFDGFPTGCTILAGLAEVAMICTDELGLNRDYQDGRDIVIVPAAVAPIVATLTRLLDDPGHVARLGRAGRATLLGLFGVRAQITPRLDLLQRWSRRVTVADQPASALSPPPALLRSPHEPRLGNPGNSR